MRWLVVFACAVGCSSTEAVPSVQPTGADAAIVEDSTATLDALEAGPDAARDSAAPTDTTDARLVCEGASDAGTRTGRCEVRGSLGPVPDVVTSCTDVYERAAGACLAFQCEPPAVWVTAAQAGPCENWRGMIGAPATSCLRVVADCCEAVAAYWKDAPDACP